ncbi:hypothetical protein ACFLUS_02050 [Chloroflexota bacterium]
MSTRRKKRRASERRLAKVNKSITIWTIIIIVLIAAVVGIARALR